MRAFAVMTATIVLGAAAATGGWRTFHADGIRVRYPTGWYATARPLTLVTSPAQVLAVASYPLPPGPGGADGCEPRAALERLPAGGAFVYGWTYGQPLRSPDVRGFPRRPRRFRLGPLVRDGCFEQPVHRLRFRQAGRLFQLYVAFGPRATAKTRATVIRILDSFVVAR